MSVRSVNTQGCRSIFRVVSVSETSARLEDQNGFQFDAPRRHTVDGEEIILQTGYVISAVIKIGTQMYLEDIFTEFPLEVSERKAFDSSGPSDAIGWEPGIATALKRW